MGVSTEDREQVVAGAIREISHIATLPEVTLQIIQLVEDPRSTAQDLHKLISNDPALCSRILKVVNSSFYGLPAQIASVDRAVVMLGLNAVKNIAIAASLAKLFRGGELTSRFSARDIWAHAVDTAATCKLVADRAKYAFSDEAFLAGLIHNIGIMVELQYDRNRLIEVIEQLAIDEDGVPGADMLEVEEQVFGASHQDFGAGLCEKWKFPKVLRWAAGHHHNPMSLAPDQQTLPSIIYLATRLVGETGGFRADLLSLDIDEAVLEALNLTPENVDELREAMTEVMEDARMIMT